MHEEIEPDRPTPAIVGGERRGNLERMDRDK
jgi:hypothetical protein